MHQGIHPAEEGPAKCMPQGLQPAEEGPTDSAANATEWWPLLRIIGFLGSSQARSSKKFASGSV
jgi:hypothetical protein